MQAGGQFHESFQRAEPPRSSDRNFGFVIAGALTLIAFAPLLHKGEIRIFLLPVSAAFGLAAVVMPSLLAPLNRLWHRLGQLLQMVVSPVVMGVIFVAGVIPTALILRATGKDPMRRKPNRGASTYWITRDPPGPAAQSMTDQF